MVFGIYQLVILLYLVAGVAAAVGLGFRRPLATRAGLVSLWLGAALHATSFSLLHTLEPTPPLTDAGPAVSLMALVAVAAFLVAQRSVRVEGLMVVLAPVALLAVSFALRRLGTPELPEIEASGGMPHAHVLLGSAGLGLLALAFIAGLLYLAEHRRLKAKRSLGVARALPSLEALDRVNVVALAFGFPLLTLSLVTGALWVEGVHGVPWTGSLHEIGASLGWLVYAVLVVLRFAVRQGARQCATSAVGGFAVFFLGYMGVGLLQ